LVTWQGPDLLNVLGISRDDLPFIKGSGETLGEQLTSFCTKFRNELFNREILYYRQLFVSEISDSSFEIVFKHLKTVQDRDPALESYSLSKVTDLSYGLASLTQRHRKFFIRKTVTVIGREASGQMHRNVRWQVDINMKDNKRISKQHAAILWNFKSQQFEIKCLSAKYPIKVNHSRVSVHDEPAPLDNGAIISVGNELFYFQLPIS
jgi:hypothetical protein